MTTTNPGRRIAPTLAALACATLLAGCSGGGDGAAVDPETSPTAGPEGSGGGEEPVRYDGEPCPDTLPTGEQTDHHGFDTDEPAEAGPDLPDADAVWVCRYDAAEDGPAGAGGTRYAWELGTTVEITDAGDLTTVTDPLAHLEPATDQMCTADLGPRYLVVLGSEGELTGVAVDAFGCREARLTDDPQKTAPGEPTSADLPAGVLATPEGYAETLASVVDA